MHKLLTQFTTGIVTIHKLFTHSLKRAANGHLRRMKRHGKKTAARNGKHGGSIVWGKGALGKLTRWRQNVENVQIFSPEGFVFVVLSIFLPPPPPFLFCFYVVVVVLLLLLLSLSLFCFQSEVLLVQPCWLALYNCGLFDVAGTYCGAQNGDPHGRIIGEGFNLGLNKVYLHSWKYGQSKSLYEH